MGERERDEQRQVKFEEKRPQRRSDEMLGASSSSADMKTKYLDSRKNNDTCDSCYTIQYTRYTPLQLEIKVKTPFYFRNK